MNRWIKAYMRQIKHLFPIFGQPEKAYLEKLRLNLEDCFEEQEPNSMEEVVQRVGRPENVVDDYYSQIDILRIEERIRKSSQWQILRACIAVIILVAIIVCAISIWHFYQEYLQRLNEMMGYFIETIE